MMKARLLKKSDLSSFLEKLSKKNKLIAPVKKDILRFSEINDVSKVIITGHPLFSAKKYFNKQKQDIFTYDLNGLTEIKESEQFIIFGMRMCDVNALLKLDKMFLDENPYEPYRLARENITLIGLNCETAPKDLCFCESMNLKDEGYDLLFCEVGDNFHIKVGSEKGEKLVKTLPESNLIPLPIKTNKKLNQKNIESLYENKAWKEEAEKCISCGACTNLCPTCLCFDVSDKPNLDLSSGKRTLEWDSCQFKDFTKVAGGHVFREKRLNRFKHRIYHKLQYFKERFGEDMCTGCARCIEGCPTKIDFVETINKMK